MAPHHRYISLRPTLPQEPLSAPDVRVSAPAARVAEAVDDSEGSPPKRARVDSAPATTTSSSSAPAVIYPPSFLKPALPLVPAAAKPRAEASPAAASSASSSKVEGVSPPERPRAPPAAVIMASMPSYHVPKYSEARRPRPLDVNGRPLPSTPPLEPQDATGEGPVDVPPPTHDIDEAIVECFLPPEAAKVPFEPPLPLPARVGGSDARKYAVVSLDGSPYVKEGQRQRDFACGVTGDVFLQTYSPETPCPSSSTTPRVPPRGPSPDDARA